MEIYKFLKSKLRVCHIILYYFLTNISYHISWLLKKHVKRIYYENVFEMITHISKYNYKIYTFACKMNKDYNLYMENSCGPTANALFNSNFFRMGSISQTLSFDIFIEKLKEYEYNIFKIDIVNCDEFECGHSIVIIKYENRYKLYQSYVFIYTLNEYLKMDDKVYNFEEFESKIISKLRILFQNKNYNLEDVKKAYFDLTYVNELRYNTKIPITFNYPIIKWYNNDYGSKKSSLSK